MHMRVWSKTIEYLRWIITWDLKKTNYLTWPKLIDFFSQFWFNDEYWEWFPSRWSYCDAKLNKINNEEKIELVISSYYNPINFIDNKDWLALLIKELNEYLYFDDSKVIIDGKRIKMVSMDSTNSESHSEWIYGSWIVINIHEDIFNHIKELLNSWHYFNAIEESYKIVREKLKEITWEEQAHKWFKEDNYELIFWHIPKNEAESNFFEWVKFLHMAIQNLRNEKAHTPAKKLDKNLAIHYITMASLAYDLITRKQ